MNKSFFKTILSLLLVFTFTMSYAQGEFYHYKEDGRNVKAVNISPDGHYVVGHDFMTIDYGSETAIGLSSFLWDLKNNTKEWLTIADTTQFEKTGFFNDVNDAGMIAGYYKDPASKITTKYRGMVTTMPVSTAALWQNGKLINLGLGTDLKLDACKKFSDGTEAVAISNDGKTVAGRYIVNNVPFPCVWKQNTEGSWEYSALQISIKDLFTGVKGSVYDISADGSVIVGEVQDNDTKNIMPAFWVNGNLNVVIPGPDDNDMYGKHIQCKAMSVSPNGEYIAMVFKKKFLTVYSVSKQSYVRVEQVDGAGTVESAAVSDNGDVMCTFICGHPMAGGVYYRPMWYSYDNKRIVDLSYFIDVYASSVTVPFNINPEDKPNCYITAVSENGLTILGNDDEPDPEHQFNKFYSAWVLKASNDNVKIPEIPTGVAARLTGTDQVTISWNPIKDNNYALKSYKIYENGVMVSEMDADTLSVNQFVLDNAKKGYVLYAVSAVYMLDNGKTLESPKSEFCKVAVPLSVANSFVEDFEKDGWKANLWSFTKDVENEDIREDWGCLPYTGLLGSYAGVTVTHITKKPYSLSAVSTPVDASEINGNVHFAMDVYKKLYDTDKVDLTKDSLSVDISTDWGNTWKEFASITAADFSVNKYMSVSYDITSLIKGSVFQFRLRSHGRAAAGVQFRIDNISIKEENTYIPSGIMVTELTDNQRLIRWKNTFGAYDLNFMGNVYTEAEGKTIGNNGLEIIGANMYDKEDLSPFQDKYLTAVTTELNWYDDKQEKTIDAAVMVWQDDILVREQSFPVEVFNKAVVIKLDAPLKIDASKTLKVGIRVNNYPKEQLPLLYYSTPNFVNNKSDLYSEDGGKTWSTLKEAFANSEFPEDGYGTWRISANITDEELIDNENIYDSDIVYYNIYRDGNVINDCIVDARMGRFLENDAPETGVYEIRAFYATGGVSALSDSYSFVPTGIDSNIAGKNSVEYDVENNMLNITGDYNDAALWSVDGHKVMSLTDSDTNLDNLPSGIYILRLNSSHGKESVKVLVK